MGKKRKIGIIGLGPVGMILATHLTDAGCEVAIYDINKLKINKIRREGIRLKGVVSKKAMIGRICPDINDFTNFKPDYLVFCVKVYQLEALIEDLLPLIGKIATDDLHVISAQNGIDSENILAATFGVSNTLRMAINFAGNLSAPNIVKVTFFNPPNYIGSIDDSCPGKAEEFAGFLNSAGLESKAIDSFELLRRVWEKTILNSSLSALCGIGKFTIKEAMDFPNTLEIVEQIIAEAVEVAEAEKIKFEDDFIRKCLRYLRKAGDHFPSLAGDLINNRMTEIDYFNGKIVEYGRKHYIRTSLNLVFTNMVKAMTHKNLISQLSDADKVLINKRQLGLNIQSKAGKAAPAIAGNCFAGIDLGSAYTKITVIDQEDKPVYQTVVQTRNRDKIALKHLMEAIQAEFPVKFSCATGYGRKRFPDSDIIKTEISCGAVGVSGYYPGSKNIIDIGGEDIKVIRCAEDNAIDDFSLNDKCAAGTGAFLVEVAERAEINIHEMSDLATRSNFNSELNSFCTVFAKTEITGWLIDGKPLVDIAKGIYLSIVNRVAKLRIDPSAPVYLIGGVVAYHPYLRLLLQEKYKREVQIVEKPQYAVSLGAALIAKNHYKNMQKKNTAGIKWKNNELPI